MISPITKEKMSEQMLADYIKRGICLFEADAQVTVTATLQRTKQPFDPALYDQFCYIEVPFKPIQKMIKLSITSANYRGTRGEHDQYPSGGDIFEIPMEWVEVSNANRGRINVIPMQSAFSAIGITTSAPASGAAILLILGMKNWMPAYWLVEFLAGFCSEDGSVPVIVNEAIGAKAAILALNNLIPLFYIASQSLGIDSMSQSVSNNMYMLLTQKREALEKDYATSLKRIKTIAGNTLFSSHI